MITNRYLPHSSVIANKEGLSRTGLPEDGYVLKFSDRVNFIFQDVAYHFAVWTNTLEINYDECENHPNSRVIVENHILHKIVLKRLEIGYTNDDKKKFFKQHFGYQPLDLIGFTVFRNRDFAALTRSVYAMYERQEEIEITRKELHETSTTLFID